MIANKKIDLNDVQDGDFVTLRVQVRRHNGLFFHGNRMLDTDAIVDHEYAMHRIEPGDVVCVKNSDATSYFVVAVHAGRAWLDDRHAPFGDNNPCRNVKTLRLVAPKERTV